jgi:hypothetical protein
MNLKFFFLAIFFTGSLFAQDVLKISRGSLFQIESNDSVICYQCHVMDHFREVNLPSGGMDTRGIEKYTITEKFVIRRNNEVFSFVKYLSPFAGFPNRRFSGLKVREKTYWEFTPVDSAVVTSAMLNALIRIEESGHDAIEFDYAITKYNTNQLIVVHGKNFRQLVIDKGLLSDVLTPLRNK